MARLKLARSVGIYPAELWPELLEVERHASELSSVSSVHITSVEGPSRVVDWALRLRGSLFRWSQTEHLAPAARTVRFQLRRGDPKFLAGQWRLRPHAAGSTVELDLEIDFGFPRVSAVVDPVLVATFTTMLREYVDHVETTVGVRPEPSNPSPSASLHPEPSRRTA